MLGPARRDNVGNVPDVFVVQPGGDSLQPGPNFLAQLGRLAGSRAPWPRQLPQVSQRQKLILCTVADEDQNAPVRLRVFSPCLRIRSHRASCETPSLTHPLVEDHPDE
jgi:hypothetical protein